MTIGEARYLSILTCLGKPNGLCNKDRISNLERGGLSASTVAGTSAGLVSCETDLQVSFSREGSVKSTFARLAGTSLRLAVVVKWVSALVETGGETLPPTKEPTGRLALKGLAGTAPPASGCF